MNQKILSLIAISSLWMGSTLCSSDDADKAKERAELLTLTLLATELTPVNRDEIRALLEPSNQAESSIFTMHFRPYIGVAPGIFPHRSASNIGEISEQPVTE